MENPFGFLDTVKEEALDTDDDDDEKDGQPKTQLEAIVKDNEKKIRAQEQ